MVYFPTIVGGPPTEPHHWGGAYNAVFNFPPGTADPATPSTQYCFNCQGRTFNYSFDPGADNNNLVFNYVYVLPAYLQAIMIFLAVAAALEPDFQAATKEGDNIRSAAQDLLRLHDRIKAGIVHIPAPNSDDMTSPTDDPNPDTGWSDQMAAGHYIFTWWESPSLLGPYPYGAVNLYSGYYSLGSYPLLDLSSGPPQYGPFIGPGPFTNANTLPGTDFYIKPVSKYLLRTLSRAKAVYREIGLSTVWETINRLRSLVGDAQMERPNFGDWSLREVFTILGYPRNQLLGTLLTVRTLIVYLRASTPFYLAPPPISLRQLLKGLPPDTADLSP
jgi:hypothetical protein